MNAFKETSNGRTITVDYDRDSRDYASYVDGIFIAYGRTMDDVKSSAHDWIADQIKLEAREVAQVLATPEPQAVELSPAMVDVLAGITQNPTAEIATIDAEPRNDGGRTLTQVCAEYDHAISQDALYRDMAGMLKGQEHAEMRRAHYQTANAWSVIAMNLRIERDMIARGVLTNAYQAALDDEFAAEETRAGVDRY
jgi:hypothetical protein